VSGIANALARRTFLAGASALAACGEHQDDIVSIYALLDVSGNNLSQLPTATRTLRDMMGMLQARDSFTVATIDACGFSQDSEILHFVATDRPKDRQRLVEAYGERLNAYAARIARTAVADIGAALADAGRRLAKKPTTQRLIVLFSDLEAGLATDCQHETALPTTLRGVEVVATNGGDAEHRARHVERWQHEVEAAGGVWRSMPNPADAVALLKDRAL
jgi:hypothetical protein